MSTQLTERGLDHEVVHFGAFDLPILDEAIPGGAGMYENEHTKAWAEALRPFDAYIVVTPEYNHSVPGPLKNAIDFVGQEFAHKPIAFVSYGADKGVRAVEAWRLVFANFRAATVRGIAAFSIFTDFADGSFEPQAVSAEPFGPMIEDLVLWAEGFAVVREKAAESVAS